MTATRILPFLFASLISIGLAISPLATPAIVAADRMDTGMMQLADMSSDMPCCPDKQKNDCQGCPLLAICMAKVLQNAPSSNGLPVREAGSQVLRPLDEPVLAGLSRPPPDQPPRTNV